MPLVCGVIVTYNPDHDFFKVQIDTLIQQLDLLIIIDNASESQNKLSKIVSRASHSIIFEKLTDNLGLSAGQNAGIIKASDLKATHIVLFDQDSLIDKNFIRGLLEAESVMLAEGKNVGAVGPLFYDPSNNVVYPATVYYGPFLKRVSLKKPKSEVEATFIISSGCLIRLEVLNQTGLMNEQLFIDYIDVEWSLRAKHLGFHVYMTSRAKMAHSIGDNRVSILGRSISIHSPLRRYYLVRNSFYMLRLAYIPFGYKVREVLFNLLRIITGLVFSKERKTFIYYIIWGIRDGILGVFGQCKH